MERKKKRNRLLIVIIVIIAAAAVAAFFVFGKNGGTDENIGSADTEITDQDASGDDGQNVSGDDGSADEENQNDTEGAAQADGDGETGTVSELSEFLPLEFYFSSGVGGWGTSLTLQSDGTFAGTYTDSEMGETGDDYPNGTVYISEFTGTFTDITKVDDNTWSMTLSELSTKAGSSWIEDGIRYVRTDPYGVESGKQFYLYTPDKATSELSEGFLSWYTGIYGEAPSDTLSCYGLYNEAPDYGFFAQE